MAYWWWILIIVLILFPMAMLKPSARQNQVIELRNKARRLGIQVSVLPKIINAAVKLEGVSYSWLRPLDAPKQKEIICLLQQKSGFNDPSLDFHGWQAIQGQPNKLSPAQSELLAPWLANLPADAFALELNDRGLTFWWHEQELAYQLEELGQAAQQILLKK